MHFTDFSNCNFLSLRRIPEIKSQNIWSILILPIASLCLRAINSIQYFVESSLLELHLFIVEFGRGSSARDIRVNIG